MVQWIERQPVYQKVTSSIPSQGTCLSCGPGPQLGACERQLINVSLSLFLPHPLSLKIIFKILKNKREKHRCVRDTWISCLSHTPDRTWPTTQACALTGNWTSNLLVYRPALNPLRHTSQGCDSFYARIFCLPGSSEKMENILDISNREDLT